MVSNAASCKVPDMFTVLPGKPRDSQRSMSFQLSQFVAKQIGEPTEHLPGDVPHYWEASSDALSREGGIQGISKRSVSVTCAVLRRMMKEWLGTVPCASKTLPYPNRKFMTFSCDAPLAKSGLFRTYLAVLGSEIVRRVPYPGSFNDGNSQYVDVPQNSP
jgi:hypothetical protein